MKIGYARVSTGLQNLNLQEDRLNAYGCEKIFSDHISGSKSKRPGLDKAIEFARSGDTIVVWRLDRLGRNMEDLITLVNELNERGVSFHSLEENITMDKSSSTGQLLFHLFAAFAEFERNLILERSSAGRIAARARGRYGGRPEKLNQKDLNLLKTLYDNGTPIKTIAEQWQVSRTTIYRYLNKLEEKEDENKEKYLTNFSEAKRKEATQKYNIIKPFILGKQSLSSISKSKGIALSTLYRWNKLYKEQGLTGLIHNTRVDKGEHKLKQNIIDEIKRLALKNKKK